MNVEFQGKDYQSVLVFQDIHNGEQQHFQCDGLTLRYATAHFTNRIIKGNSVAYTCTTGDLLFMAVCVMIVTASVISLATNNYRKKQKLNKEDNP